MHIDDGGDGVYVHREGDWIRQAGYDTILPLLTKLVPGDEPVAVQLAQKMLKQVYGYQREVNPEMNHELCGTVLRTLMQQFILSQFPHNCIRSVLTTIGVHEPESRRLAGNMLLAVNLALPRSIVLAVENAATQVTGE